MEAEILLFNLGKIRSAIGILVMMLYALLIKIFYLFTFYIIIRYLGQPQIANFKCPAL